METVANERGLRAEQITVPLDHAFIPEARTLPAIIVVQLPSGLTHFVVVWNRIGEFLQVMDPATGRRWVHRRALSGELYRHRMLVPAEGWREWAGTEDFQRVLRVRLRTAGVSPSQINQGITCAVSDPGWQGLATLDAATRFLQYLKESGSVNGSERVPLLERLVNRPHLIPAQYWTVAPAAADEYGAEQVLVSGAVLVRALGRDQNGERESLHADSKRADPSPLAFAFGLLGHSGMAGVLAAGAGIAASAALTVGEAILFRSFFDLFARLRLPEQRAASFFALAVFAVAALALEWSSLCALNRLGRQLEVRLRLALLQKLACLSDQYLHSRLISDLAERSHAAFRLMQLPGAMGRILTPAVRLICTLAGLLWLMPHAWPLLGTMVLAAVLPPLVAQHAIRERDLKTRTHAGALTRFYLDAMLGLLPIRAHRAARNLQAEQEKMLGEWGSSAVSLQRVTVFSDSVQTVLVLAPVIALFLLTSFALMPAGRLLLAVYWTLNVPLLGQDLALQIRRLPAHLNLLARFTEPLWASEEPAGGGSALEHAPEIRFEQVSVAIAGTPILTDVDLTIKPGEHVAIIGRSGAGKSSLVGLLLGWLTPSGGAVRIDGRDLDIGQIRRSVAWVDPAIQIWNDSLFANITYGCQDQSSFVAQAIDRSMLREVLESLPSGLQTKLGESGGLVSGGEGQRVRFARATLRQDARVVILDEPFRGLDRAKRRELLARARQIWRDATVLCVTHDIHQTRSFDRVIVIEGGQICECGTPTDLLADAGSRYSQLVAAERNAYAGLWSAHFWRRIWVEDGKVVETPLLKPEAEVA